MSLNSALRSLGRVIAEGLYDILISIIGIFILLVFPIGGAFLAIYLVVKIPFWTGLDIVLVIPLVFLLALFFMIYVWDPFLQPAVLSASDALQKHFNEGKRKMWIDELKRKGLISSDEKADNTETPKK